MRALSWLKRSWPDKLLPIASIRFLMIFFTGVVSTLIWQSYGDAIKEAVAAWSPRCGWPAAQAASVPQMASVPQPAPVPQVASVPQPAPVPQTGSGSPAQLPPVSLDQLKATSLALDSVRQIIDKLAMEITKLQVNEQEAPDRNPPVLPPAAAPPRKFVAPAPARALPVH